VLLVLLSPSPFSERFGAGARPVHPILGHRTAIYRDFVADVGWPRANTVAGHKRSFLGSIAGLACAKRVGASLFNLSVSPMLGYVGSSGARARGAQGLGPLGG
jgi:hypothetical protein